MGIAKKKIADTPPSQSQALKDEILSLRKELRDAYREEIQTDEVRRVLFKIANSKRKDVSWLDHGKVGNFLGGIPTLFASDWHWGETVNPSEIQGMNAYNLSIARERARNCFSRFIDVYMNQFKFNSYKGCVLILGGDMLSGDIHDELKETNGEEVLPCIISITDEICSGIKALKKAFGKVGIFAVTGNHGRTSKKPRFKRRAYTNYDWLIYTSCEKMFDDDPDIMFNIPTGPDVLFKIYSTRYLLTHGDNLGKGGDGLIGMIGPVTRGDIKRRTRQMLMHDPYDVMLCGHFHQLAMLRSRIVNGSLKGYDEFAYGLGFAPEPPLQASWITNPSAGITLQVPIPCEGDNEKYDGESWLSWKVQNLKKKVKTSRK